MLCSYADVFFGSCSARAGRKRKNQAPQSLVFFLSLAQFIMSILVFLLNLIYFGRYRCVWVVLHQKASTRFLCNKVSEPFPPLCSLAPSARLQLPLPRKEPRYQLGPSLSSAQASLAVDHSVKSMQPPALAVTRGRSSARRS